MKTVSTLYVTGLLTLMSLLLPVGSSSSTGRDTDREKAIERTRREVRLLDDIYKTAIVLVTEHYVRDDTSLPAGSAFKALFEAVAKKGWHEVRLIDATGQPYSDLNLPKDGFEKNAIRALLEGKASYEEITTEGNRTFLHMATAIPVVMDKCIMCHENYREVAHGQAIGALSYKLPLVE
ncbi:MAG: DUF3365 domain-containing protein [Planctomycetota bacterium]